MAKRKTQDEEAEELVMVGPDGDVTEDEEEPIEEKEEKEEKEPPKKKVEAKEPEAEEDDEDEEDDERVGHSEDDHEEDSHGKRESRKARRERQRRARQRNEVELNFLRQRNEVLEKRVNEVAARQGRSEVGNLDQRIQGLQSQLKVANNVLAQAVTAQNGDDVVEATEIRDQIRDNLGRLSAYKNELVRRTQAEPPAEVDPRLVSNASNWIKENRWYDPNGGDKDSRVVTDIDNRLVQEGYDPRNPDYWDELTDRVRSRLPHRFNGKAHDDDDDDSEVEERKPKVEPQRKPSGPRFSVGGRERPLRKNEVYVSPERKQALQDAGVWDDPVLRQKYLKRYAQWDRENSRGR